MILQGMQYKLMTLKIDSFPVDMMRYKYSRLQPSIALQDRG